ncbi:hypothetical protein ABI_24980 [Asticcacaulis biprosthecium C19]|uniref:PLD phosphodiesterase domain-containing protein n=1 Tax=Asticcacaulis biprosthecium C19 TaxID=715226 RepID=F4QP27_9CAUL|nr:phospholipase D family protein [Asticcacaulis biprosthecium]EGF91085.1 hypothetical protein ABI_24980 [Asticcacaulis biprosthecium C19]
MSKFLAGAELSAEISKLLAESGGCHAVAFWGNGAELRLPNKGQGDFRVICNLTSNGTNPYTIEKLKLENVRHSPGLHAKVYIGDQTAIIGSANVSTNGLGSENVAETWLEAGVVVKKTAAIDAWFETLWDDALEISDADLSRAKVLWDRRPPQPVFSFAHFDVEASDLPLLTWSLQVRNPVNNIESVKAKLGLVGEESDEKINTLINNSMEVENEHDKKILTNASWAMFWYMNKSNTIKKGRKPYWFKPGMFFEKTFRDDDNDEPGEYRDSVFPSDDKSLEPFEVDEIFIRSFFATLERPEFFELINLEYKEPWFNKMRLRLTREFWVECKREYLKEAEANERIS